MFFIVVAQMLPFSISAQIFVSKNINLIWPKIEEKKRKILSSQFVNSFLSSQDLPKILKNPPILLFCPTPANKFSNIFSAGRSKLKTETAEAAEARRLWVKKIRLIYDFACSGNRSLPGWMSSELCLENIF